MVNCELTYLYDKNDNMSIPPLWPYPLTILYRLNARPLSYIKHWGKNDFQLYLQNIDHARENERSILIRNIAGMPSYLDNSSLVHDSDYHVQPKKKLNK